MPSANRVKNASPMAASHSHWQISRLIGRPQSPDAIPKGSVQDTAAHSTRHRSAPRGSGPLEDLARTWNTPQASRPARAELSTSFPPPQRKGSFHGQVCITRLTSGRLWPFNSDRQILNRQRQTCVQILSRCHSPCPGGRECAGCHIRLTPRLVSHAREGVCPMYAHAICPLAAAVGVLLCATQLGRAETEVYAERTVFTVA